MQGRTRLADCLPAPGRTLRAARPGRSAFAAPLLAAFALALSAPAAAQDPPPPPDPIAVVNAIASRYAASYQYTFDASFELARKNGEDSREAAASLKIKLAVAPQGKYLLWAGEKEDLQYLVVSDGQNTWAYMPGKNRYLKLKAGAAAVAADPDDAYARGIGEADREIFLSSKLVVPILNRLARSVVFVDMNRTADITFKGEDRTVPVLTVLSQRSEGEGQSLTELVLEPETNNVLRVEWTKSAYIDEEQRFSFIKADFEKLRLGDPIAPSFFTFTPPDDAQPVENLPIPGLDAAALLTKDAPDFELELVNGQRFHLSELRGRTVLLAFWATWCLPCQSEMAALAKLQEEYKDKGLAVLAIGSEGKAVAGRYTGRAGFPPIVLDDSSGRVHRMYHVNFVPTAILIDAKGKVVRVLTGARDAETLKNALKSAGL